MSQEVTMNGLNGLNWYWIVWQLTAAPLMGLVVTLPFWRKNDIVFGNVVGTAVILAWALGLILVEYVHIARSVDACFAAGTTCFPVPSAFARFAVHAAIGLGEVFLLFTVSLTVERRISNRDYAVEWRR
jgi:hypothetical protein